MIVIGRDSNGIPIVLGDCASSTFFRLRYKEVRLQLSEEPTEKLKAFLEKNDPKFRARFFHRWLGYLVEFLFASPTLLAVRDEFQSLNAKTNQ